MSVKMEMASCPTHKPLFPLDFPSTHHTLGNVVQIKVEIVANSKNKTRNFPQSAQSWKSLPPTHKKCLKIVHPLPLFV